MTSFLQLLASAAAVAMTVPGFVLAVRAIPAVDRLVLAGQKPWACDVCMCFWSTGLWASVLAGIYHDAWLLLVCGPAYTVAMAVLAWMTRAPVVGPGPPLEEEHGLAEKLEGRP